MLKKKYDYKPLAVIDFFIFKTRIEATREMKKNYTLAIVIDEANYKIKIKSIGKSNYLKLLTSIRIKSAKHDPFIKFNYRADSKFYKNLYIQESDFLANANSGDLLLFK